MTNEIVLSSEELRRRLLAETVVEKPYPHLLIEPAMNWGVYKLLEATFPQSEIVYSGQKPQNNRAYLLDAIDTLGNKRIDPVWRETFAQFASTGFFRDALAALIPHTRRLFPDFEARLGKRLEDCSLALRNGGDEADLYFDVQVGINSPVTRISRVRAIHIDNPKKIFNALLYMRHPDDFVDGGDLGIYRWRGHRRYSRVSVAERDALLVSVVPYAKNRLLLFHNSPDSLHGVTPRAKTPIVRRYINFLLEARIPLFELSDYQTAPITKFFDKALRRYFV